MYMVCQEHESAYWDGEKGVCCDGKVYIKDTEDTSYACCTTGYEVSIVQGKENLNHCCPEGQTAYWNGSAAQCCTTATHQIVTDYINGQSETAYACCETKEDVSIIIDDFVCNPADDPDYCKEDGLTTKTNFTLVGAANGSCCGGYETTEDYYQAFSSGHDDKDNYSYSIRQNGGSFYCAVEREFLSYSVNSSHKTFLQYLKKTYVNDSQYCDIELTEDGTVIESYCYCSSKGDPKNGSRC